LDIANPVKIFIKIYKIMYTLPPLPYGYDALEPHIDEATMRIHHDKHHQAYLDKLNKALEGNPELMEKPIEALLADLGSVQDEIRTAVQNHGGGYLHHSLFWQMMSPEGGGEPPGKLAEAIRNTFGSFEAFREAFTLAASTVFGSGWAWLVRDAEGKLEIVKTGNQDSPVSQGLTPLIGIDVWEHAYYLKYQNRRPDFISAWWNVVNWKFAEAQFGGKDPVPGN
jgi:Fe-Mn family superoxide dismutase